MNACPYCGERTVSVASRGTFMVENRQGFGWACRGCGCIHAKAGPGRLRWDGNRWIPVPENCLLVVPKWETRDG